MTHADKEVLNELNSWI